MIARLRRKFVLIVMLVVTLILLAIFFTMLLTTQRNNERISEGILRQALNTRSFAHETRPSDMPSRPFPPVGNNNGPSPNMRLPILVVAVAADGTVSTISNQLHFIAEADIAPLAALALNRAEDSGILQNDVLRYMRAESGSITQIAFADISIEQELLKTQIANSLLIGGLAMLAFFLLSLLLARWAVRPVALAWEQQKQFIANASHELKTPLTVILSNADMLRADKPIEDEKTARRMDHIHTEAVRMKQLVEDMLTLAQTDSAAPRAHHAPVDFSYIVKSAALMYEPIAFDENKSFSHQITEGLWTPGDAGRLQQAAHILLDNALKYAPHCGDIHVSLSAAEHNTILLAVSNNGTPIPADELATIFLRFYRRDEARSAHGSFGLGLSIAQNIVTTHNGKIWAESDEACNHFYISLPQHN